MEVTHAARSQQTTPARSVSRPPRGWPRSTRCCLPRPVPAGCGAELAVTGPDGSTAALGTCEHWAGEPGSLDLTWGAVRRFQLTPQVPGPDAAGALDELLARWRDHLATVPEAATGGHRRRDHVARPGHRRAQAPPAARAGPARGHRGPRRRAPCRDRGAGGARRADPPGRARRTWMRSSGSAWRRSATTPTSAP